VVSSRHLAPTCRWDGRSPRAAHPPTVGAGRPMPPRKMAVTSLALDEPDVAEDDRVAVVLKVDGRRLRGAGLEREGVVDLDAVVPDAGDDLAVGLLDLDVVGLPGQRRQAHVHAGGLLAVEGAALVLLALQAEAVQHLDLDAVHEDAAVAAALAARLRHEGRAQLDVQLARGEALLAARAAVEQVALDHLAVLPLVGALAVEQHDRPLRRLRPQRRALALDALEADLPAVGRLAG